MNGGRAREFIRDSVPARLLDSPNATRGSAASADPRVALGSEDYFFLAGAFFSAAGFFSAALAAGLASASFTLVRAS